MSIVAGENHTPHIEDDMDRAPEYAPRFPGAGKLEGKVAIVTGGDSGIGRAVSVLFAREGARVAIVYRASDSDAEHTQKLVEEEGSKALLFKGDIGNPAFCSDIVAGVVDAFGQIDVVVNNAGEQHPTDSFEEVSSSQLGNTFQTNVFGQFYLVQAALPHLDSGASILCTTSVTAYRGQDMLIDYSSSKGAVLAFVRALAHKLAPRGIRVNGVAPGPIWTPLIPSTFPADKVEKFGRDTPLGRAGQPNEVAPAFLFLACEDASYVTGQIIHPNGGEPISG